MPGFSIWIKGDVVVFGTWLCTKDMGLVTVDGFGLVKEYRHVDQDVGWTGLRGKWLTGSEATGLLETMGQLLSRRGSADPGLIAAIHDALKSQESLFKSLSSD